MASNSKIMFFILCIVVVPSFQARFLAYDDHTMSITHEKWMAKHGRYYESKEEKEKRFKIFKDNVKYIESFNKRGRSTYELGVNAFADLTKEEFLTNHAKGFTPTLQRFLQSAFKYENVIDVPFSLDWRDQRAVTPVKGQGGCGSCWAFSVVAAMEGLVQIKSGVLVSFSEQNIMDCDDAGDGCHGGRMEKAFDYVARSGALASDTDYPYQQREGTCSSKPASLPIKITGHGVVPPNNETAMLMAVANQPVSVGIDPSLFQFYHSGVITGSCGTTRTHAVTAVGYGTNEDGVKFWLMKNSWGPGWGENGYVRLQRDIEAPEGMCGLAMDLTYPTA